MVLTLLTSVRAVRDPLDIIGSKWAGLKNSSGWLSVVVLPHNIFVAVAAWVSFLQNSDEPMNMRHSPLVCGIFYSFIYISLSIVGIHAFLAQKDSKQRHNDPSSLQFSPSEVPSFAGERFPIRNRRLFFNREDHLDDIMSKESTLMPKQNHKGIYQIENENQYR